MATERMGIAAVPKSKSHAQGIVTSARHEQARAKTPAAAQKSLASLAHGLFANKLVIPNAVSIATVGKAAPNGGPLQIANRLLGRGRRLRPLHTLVGKPPIL